MYKYFLFFLFLFGNTLVNAQSFETSFHSLAGTNSQLPFWLWANQQGRYDKNSSTIQNLVLDASYNSQIKKSDFAIESQACANFLLADNNTILFTELFAGLNWKFLQIKAGVFSEEELYNGLSASNGNLSYSQNAQPHPRIRLDFNRFVPIVSNCLSIYGVYEEGLLNDERYVTDTHLHHASFYFRLGNREKLEFTGGLEHYVMWWGTHPVYGELPGWEEYFNYITSSSGGTLPTDQENALGNTYGSYQVEIKKKWDKLQASFYLSHPFEDKSGLEWANWRDNLYGLFIDFTKNPHPLVQSILIEYYYSKHQSGSYHLEEQPDGSYSGRGLDNYFNNGVYRSGVSYKQLAMGSPIFAPLVIDDEISLGFENNRISGIHFGANGFLNNKLKWKSKLSYTRNFGIYRAEGATSYTPERKQLSSLLQFDWQPSSKPLFIGISLAADYGSLFDDGQSTTRLGGMLSLNWKIF